MAASNALNWSWRRQWPSWCTTVANWRFESVCLAMLVGVTIDAVADAFCGPLEGSKPAPAANSCLSTNSLDAMCQSPIHLGLMHMQAIHIVTVIAQT